MTWSDAKLVSVFEEQQALLTLDSQITYDGTSVQGIHLVDNL